MFIAVFEEHSSYWFLIESSHAEQFSKDAFFYELAYLL